MITFSNTVPFEITRDELRALTIVVAYLWEDENKDYECNKEHDHIFLSVKTADGLTRRAAERFELHDRQVR